MNMFYYSLKYKKNLKYVIFMVLIMNNKIIERGLLVKSKEKINKNINI